MRNSYESALRSRIADRGLTLTKRPPLRHPSSMLRLPWVVWKRGEYSNFLSDGTVVAQFNSLEEVDKAYPPKVRTPVMELVNTTDAPVFRFNFLVTAEEAHDIQWLFSLAIGEATEKFLTEPLWESRMIYLQNLRDKILAGKVEL